jgi:exodeoxyribonuclease V alpha subunit
MSSALRDRDPHDVRLAATAPEPLRAFNDAGVLTAADVQVARALARLGGDDTPELLLAFALAVRAPRLGHVLVDLATIRATVAVDTEEPVDLGALPWPEPEAWAAIVAQSALVSVLDEDPPRGGTANARPLHLSGTRLYLDRYWREERAVATDLRARAAAPPAAGTPDAALTALFPDPLDTLARTATTHTLTHHLTIIAGGPGTGKTTTIARALALLLGATPDTPPLVALVAPTGKAAARLAEAVREEAARLDVPEDVRAKLVGLDATTIHRRLGSVPRSRSRFHHHRGARLPHDVVIVDESSMVSLTLMARLLEAVRPDARLVLVGDPDQLSSIEAGAVLGDVVAAEALADQVVVLDRGHRFTGAIAVVADAVRRGDGDALIGALRENDDAVTWVDADPAAATAADLAPVRAAAVAAGRAVIDAAVQGDAGTALSALEDFRLLCAHRRGPHGVSTWMPQVEAWLAREIEQAGGRARDYPGRPLLITQNDYDLNLFNGDTGVIVHDHETDRLLAAFERTTVRPNQLGAVDTVYAMTVHKSQGSQFGTAAVILPPPASRILTRELLYTGVTRARDRLIVVGTEASLRAALARPATRASGLAARLG